MSSNIGVKLRHARMTLGMTLKEVADKANCSESMLSKVETDRANPSLSTLQRLATVLNINIAALFSSAELDGPVTRAGDHPRIELDALRQGTGVTLERVIPYSKAHMLQANIHVVSPGGSSAGLITHVGEEVGYVIEGVLELTIGEEVHKVTAGDTFCFRSEVPHGYRNIGETPARVMWVNTPPTF